MLLGPAPTAAPTRPHGRRVTAGGTARRRPASPWPRSASPSGRSNGCSHAAATWSRHEPGRTAALAAATRRHRQRRRGRRATRSPAEPSRCSATGYRLALVAAPRRRPTRLRVVYLFIAAGRRPARRAASCASTEPARRSRAWPRCRSPPAASNARCATCSASNPSTTPCPRRLVRHQHWPDGWYPMRHDAGPATDVRRHREPFPFLTVEGPGVYEIPVGPVHAGLIEPGHFRFSVVGETILNMKARLWFVHKGIEKLFEGRDPPTRHPARRTHLRRHRRRPQPSPTASPSKTPSASTVPVAGRRLRALLLELERLYNHVADLGALCNDVGYGIINAHALRIREPLLRLNKRRHRPPAAARRHRPRRRRTCTHLPDTGELAQRSPPTSPRSSTSPSTTAPSSTASPAPRSWPRTGAATSAHSATSPAPAGVDIDARRDHPFADLRERFARRRRNTTATSWPASASASREIARPSRSSLARSDS